MKTIVLIAAAGRGLRASLDKNQSIPKQYKLIEGIPVLRHTLLVFENHDAVDAIIAIINPEDKALYEEASAGIVKLLPPVEGGSTRQLSVFNGLAALNKQNPDFVLIHDGARPLVSVSLIDRVLAKLQSSPAVIPTLPVADTLKQATGDTLGHLVDRDSIRAIQTPQGFHFNAILNAHQSAVDAGGIDLTDDSEVAAKAGIHVHTVEGERTNIKITNIEDFEIMERLLNSSTSRVVRTGTGFDVHKFGDGDKVILCGVEITHDKSLVGHSDADVGLHALTDAILGAIGAGDIGSHFPPSDDKWKSANSATFLGHAAALVGERGDEISNVDVTLICELPKIAPHRSKMRSTVAKILSLDIEQVSVKATTTEGLGFTGRGEGIAAQASATILISKTQEAENA